MDNSEIVKCDACGYHAPVERWYPANDMMNDLECPRCYSLNNLHNIKYAAKMQKSLKPLKDREAIDAAIGEVDEH